MLIYLCGLCLSMIDEHNQFYRGKCCTRFYICRACYRHRTVGPKPRRVCPNPQCDGTVRVPGAAGAVVCGGPW